jgi:branched-chain amino acid transport system substrate-binding protein
MDYEGVDRRHFLKVAAGSAGLAAAGPWALSGHSAADRSARRPTVKIGYIGPLTGLVAPFLGAPAGFVSGQLRSYFNKHGLLIDGVRHKVEITVLDTMGSPAEAATAVSVLVNDGVHVILVQDDSEIITLVSRLCQRFGVPCVSTGVPWEQWFKSLGGKLHGGRAGSTSWKWPYHFFYGLTDIDAVYADLWSSLHTNKEVGGLWPRDSAGSYFATGKNGIPAALDRRGYHVKSGRYADGDPNIGSLATTFKNAHAQILTGTPDPGDFQAFRSAARARGYEPVIATISGFTAFPASVNPVGAAATDLSCEVWWSPAFPYRSSITGQTSAQLAAEFTSATKLQWSQAVGSAHAMFEVARAALVRARSLSHAHVAEALSRLRVTTVVGPLSWIAGPVRNVSRTPLVGGQWQRGTTYRHNLVIVANKPNPKIPLGGHLKPVSFA